METMIATLVGIVILGIVIWQMNRYYQTMNHLCPKCGAVIDPDAYHYRHTIVWTCRECGNTFETMK